MRGGGGGATGAIYKNGKDLSDKALVNLQHGDVMTLITPGSGDMGEPFAAG